MSLLKLKFHCLCKISTVSEEDHTRYKIKEQISYKNWNKKDTKPRQELSAVFGLIFHKGSDKTWAQNIEYEMHCF